MQKNNLKLALKIALIVIFIITVTISVRFAAAVRQVKNAEAAATAIINSADLGSTNSVSIMPLFEAWARSNEFQSGHGVSYLIKTDQATILMDLGNSEEKSGPEPLLHNMKQLEIEMSDIDAIFISHNHPDHVGGLSWWKKGSFAAGEQQNNLSDKVIYLPVQLSYPGLKPIIATEPEIIAPGVASLGRQPFIQPFPFWLWEPLGWEQALAVNIEGKGLILIMGCGHPSVERIVAQAEKVFAEPVVGLFGGFHYLRATEEELLPHIEYVTSLKPELVALSPHDSSGDVLQIFENTFPDAYRYIVVGSEIVYP